jgi:hypothetical protein
MRAQPAYGWTYWLTTSLIYLPNFRAFGSMKEFPVREHEAEAILSSENRLVEGWPSCRIPELTSRMREINTAH